MGKYINAINGIGAPSKGKVDFILANVSGALLLSNPPGTWQEGLVCVVDNLAFEAAAYAYDEHEMNVFKELDGRLKKWLLVPNAKEYAK